MGGKVVKHAPVVFPCQKSPLRNATRVVGELPSYSSELPRNTHIATDYYVFTQVRKNAVTVLLMAWLHFELIGKVGDRTPGRIYHAGTSLLKLRILRMYCCDHVIAADERSSPQAVTYCGLHYSLSEGISERCRYSIPTIDRAQQTYLIYYAPKLADDSEDTIVRRALSPEYLIVQRSVQEPPLIPQQKPLF